MFRVDGGADVNGGEDRENKRLKDRHQHFESGQ